MTVGDEPLFSVVIPTHDRSDLLGLAVRSVLAQSVQDFEIVVVDDGGFSKPPVIDDARVRMISQERGGAGKARNTGVHAARGKFITFLDDDDEFTPDRLDQAVEGLRFAPIALCWKAGLQRGDLRWTRRLYGDCSGIMLESPIPQVGSAAIRRDLVLPMDEWMRASEDLEWWLRMGQVATVHTVQRVGYLIRDHDGERLTDGVAIRLEERLRVLQMHRDYFRDYPAAAAFQWRRAAGFAQTLGLKRRAVRYYATSVRVSPRTAIRHAVLTRGR